MALALATADRLFLSREHYLARRTLWELGLARARAALEPLLADYLPGYVVLLAARPSPVAAAVIAWARTHLSGTAAHLAEADVRALRRAFAPPDTRPSNRALALALSARFPELHRPPRLAADGRPLQRFGVPDDTERRDARKHLAVAAALSAIEPPLATAVFYSSPLCPPAPRSG